MTGGALAERHLRELRDGSGIPPDVIAEAGCWTATTPAEVAALGFTATYQQLPGLVFPVHPPDGSNGLYVLKPDHPRPADKPGKVVKYEWASGRPHRLDVPPRCRAALEDPAADLYVVEGSKKAACLAGLGVAAVGLAGVWAWGKKPTPDGRCELLADWDGIPVDGRRVFVVFDSDLATNPQVALAARQFASRLAERGAWVYLVSLPAEPDGSKNGVDDLVVRHGADAFGACVEAAIAEGPHGTAALARRVRALEQQASRTAAVLRNPALRPGEKLVAIAAIHEAGWRESTGAETPYTVRLPRLAEATGLATRTVGLALDTLSGETGPFAKQVTRTYDDSTGWTSCVKLTPRQAGGVPAMLAAAARYEPERPPVEPRPEPRCPDHPDAAVVKRSRLICKTCGQVFDDGRPAVLKRRKLISETPPGPPPLPVPPTRRILPSAVVAETADPRGPPACRACRRPAAEHDAGVFHRYAPDGRPV